MQFSKFTLNTDEQVYQFTDTLTEEHDTTHQILARAEDLSRPDEGEAEGSVILIGNGGGIGQPITGIQGIAINGRVILNRLPADH